MDLAPEQYFVYAWRYTDDTVCKLGVSTLRTFYARIKAAKTVTYQDIELLGIEVFDTEAEARTAYQQRLKMFARVADRRAWVHFDTVVRQWLATECMSTPPTLDAFKDAFQNDPARREKEREYQQRRSSQKRTTRNRSAAKPVKKRTEKDRAYEREYARKRRENDPAYKEKQMQRQKAWRAKNVRIMIKIGMRLTRNTRKVGSRRVGNGMRMILSIGRSRNSVAGNLHRIIRTIRRSEGCICRNIVNGRRRKGKRNSYQLSVISGQKSGLGNVR